MKQMLDFLTDEDLYLLMMANYPRSCTMVRTSRLYLVKTLDGWYRVRPLTNQRGQHLGVRREKVGAAELSLHVTQPLATLGTSPSTARAKRPDLVAYLHLRV